MLLLLSGRRVVMWRSSLLVPFLLHQVMIRRKSELGTKAKLIVELWEGRGGPVREMQRATESLHHPLKYSADEVALFKQKAHAEMM